MAVPGRGAEGRPALLMKVVMAGESCVGKTSIVRRYTEPNAAAAFSSSSYLATIGECPPAAGRPCPRSPAALAPFLPLPFHSTPSLGWPCLPGFAAGARCHPRVGAWSWYCRVGWPECDGALHCSWFCLQNRFVPAPGTVLSLCFFCVKAICFLLYWCSWLQVEAWLWHTAVPAEKTASTSKCSWTSLKLPVPPSFLTERLLTWC